jgi:hypothetical protein
MSDVRLVVIYARPKDTDVFKRAYTDQHVPLAVEKLDGKSKIVATKITGSAQALPHKILLTVSAGPVLFRCKLTCQHNAFRFMHALPLDCSRIC